MSEIHRTIKAILYPNPLKNAKGKYLARTTSYNTYTIKDICESLHGKPGIVTNPDTMEYHVKLFLEEMAVLLEEGNKINTGYFTAQANVKGSFDTKAEKYDRQKHSVEIAFSAGHKLRKKAAELQAEILHINSENYGIQKVMDAQTRLDTTRLIKNRLLIITGTKIKITGDNPAVGLYLTHTGSGVETHYPPSALYENSNATLSLIVPELAPGTYLLKVTTQYAGNSIPLTKPRTLTYANLLETV